ncbi:rhodanese-like domain-containing protein [Tamlana fucoidanivorans]|uniref:Rhodanese-like domain-containing protein n=1 Tax=Allotamlana fucoidanivorans TaxID=2583814 RepID=A0A5C4SKB4_9FLAO|nr:rhodanese-like domain-containing protein [Tamlana fucoidanivorans]TNJ43833.1 rhodanese-like domain-containing protein [Tamlana fucoidanivorans]
MKHFIVIAFIFLISSSSFSQKQLEKLLQKENNGSIPYIHIRELVNSIDTIILLDARARKEYNISHLKNAQYIGYDFFNIDTIIKLIPEKTSQIVVYCSLGIRSEDIAVKLKQAGYSDVKNLYGGIFEWKNQGHKVYNLKEIETDSIHTFSKAWSKWLKKGIKVYD